MTRVATALALVAVLSGCVGSSEQRPKTTRAAAQNTAGGGYVVKPGDTLSAIAARLGVGMTALAQANALAPPYLIRVGQRLAIPRRGAALAMRSESRPVVQPLPREPTPRETFTPAPTPASSLAAPPASIGTAPRLAWPADGPVGQAFGSGSDPRGIAIYAHPGAAVRAAAGGTVIFAGTEPQRFGQLVLVDHGGGWVTAYGHLARLVVSDGEAVRANARLGFVALGAAGAEGRLHFELRRDNVAVDPAPLLPPRF